MCTKLSIVLPIFNEKEEEVNSNIIRLIQFLNLKHKEIEVLVVDDFSNPSFTLNKELEHEELEIKVFYNSKKMGKGGSLRKGFLESSGDILIMMDGDLPVHLNDLHLMIEIVSNDLADVVIGTRKQAKSKLIGTANFSREILSNIFIKFINLLFLPGISDTQCPIKIFRRDLILNMVSTLKSNQYLFDVEILLKSRNNKITVYEHPVTWEDKRSSWSLQELITISLSVGVEVISLFSIMLIHFKLNLMKNLKKIQVRSKLVSKKSRQYK